MEAIDEKHSKLLDESIDRISKLPDDILGHILSYLSTKNVVATSVLSKRWKTLFPSHFPLTQLYLDDSEFLRGRQRYSQSFADFVTKLFDETLRDVPAVEKVVLNCDKYCDNRDTLSWFSACVRLNVRKLKLVLTYNPWGVEGLFSVFNGCATLVELEVDSEYNLYVPEDIRLPNLKKLSLLTMSLPKYAYSINELIRGCPMLEELSIIDVKFAGVDKIYIQSELLKKLCIEYCHQEDECKIVVEAPNLEYFVYGGFKIADYAIKSFRSLHSASIDFDGLCKGWVFRLAKLVEECSCASRLCLYGSAIFAATEVVSWFPNLTCLALGCIGVGKHGWQMLAHLLQRAPKLESLKIEEGFKYWRKDTGNYAAFESLLQKSPSCLELSFEKFEFWGFQGKEDEIKLIEYFLSNARVLQEVIVYYRPPQDINLLPRLSSFKKLSSTCRVLLMDGDKRKSPSRDARNQWF